MTASLTIWTDERTHRELRTICDGLGRFPSASNLRQIGRNDLACAMTRRGGMLRCAQRLGVSRAHSDSDTGWEGERAAMLRLAASGLYVTRSEGVKAPLDLLVEGLLRVDVESARRANYDGRVGWYYQIGKLPQADLVLLWQLDTSDFYALLWFVGPRTNITISTDGGKYAAYRNSIQIIREMLTARQAERDRLRAIAASN